MVYYNERTQIKVSNRWRNTGQGPGEIGHGATSHPLPGELCGQCLFLPAMMCDNIHGILSTTEAYQALASRVFMGDQWYRRGRLPTWLTLVPSPSRGQATMWPKPHPLPTSIPDIVNKNMWHGLRSPCKQKDSFLQSGPRVTFQELAARTKSFLR